MRTAKPEELTSRAYPLFTARVSEQELSTWFPHPLEEITDPEATPEPSKGALLKLHGGPCFVVYWGHISKQLTVCIARNTDPADFLSAFFREAALPPARISWRRADAGADERVNASTSSCNEDSRTAHADGATYASSAKR